MLFARKTAKGISCVCLIPVIATWYSIFAVRTIPKSRGQWPDRRSLCPDATGYHPIFHSTHAVRRLCISRYHLQPVPGALYEYNNTSRSTSYPRILVSSLHYVRITYSCSLRTAVGHVSHFTPVSGQYRNLRSLGIAIPYTLRARQHLPSGQLGS